MKPFIIFSFCALFAFGAFAQMQTFNAGIVGGLNFAELEGEGITDYFGLNAGVTASAKFAKHWQLGLELLYSQNGEYVLPYYYPPVRYGEIWLHHIELPIHIDLLVGLFERTTFYDWHIQLGGAYTRVISHSAYTLDKTEVTDFVQYDDRDNWVLQAGTSYFFTEHFGWNLRASLPLQQALGFTLSTRVVWLM